MRLLSAVIAAVLGATVSSNAQPRGTGPMAAAVQLRVEIDNGNDVLASAVLVHRVDDAHGVVLYFLTSAKLLRPATAGAGIEGEDRPGGQNATSDIAVLRLRVENSVLTPAAMTLEPVRDGAPFAVIGHTVDGVGIVVPQRLQDISARSATGDLEMNWAVGCVGEPAFDEKGVFGVVTECGNGRPPTITLLSAARPLLRRLIPGVDLGPEEAQTSAIENQTG